MMKEIILYIISSSCSMNILIWTWLYTRIKRCCKCFNENFTSFKSKLKATMTKNLQLHFVFWQCQHRRWQKEYSSRSSSSNSLLHMSRLLDPWAGFMFSLFGRLWPGASTACSCFSAESVITPLLVNVWIGCIAVCLVWNIKHNHFFSCTNRAPPMFLLLPFITLSCPQAALRILDPLSVGMLWACRAQLYHQEYI